MHMHAVNQKKSIVEALLNKGLIKIVIDATKPGVSLPAHLMGNTKVVLNLSWKFRTLMELLEDGIHVNLSFAGEQFSCAIPWSSIWLVEQGNTGFIDPEAMPSDEPLFSVPEEKLEEPGKMKLEAINGNAELTPPRTGHLRVVH